MAHLSAADTAALGDFDPAHDRSGSVADITHSPSNVRFTPVSSTGRRPKADIVSLPREPGGGSHCGKNRTLRDWISLPQLVFLPRAEIAGNAAIFSPRWTMNAS
jgi:hypothetical protein